MKFINKALGGTDSALVCKDVTDWPDPTLSDDRRGDLMVFKRFQDAPPLATPLTFANPNHAHPERLAHAARSDFAGVMIEVEPKLNFQDGERRRGRIC